MRISLKVKLFAPLFIITVISCVFIFLVLLPHNVKAFKENHEVIAKKELQNVADLVGDMIIERDYSGLESIILSLQVHNEQWRNLHIHDEKGNRIFTLNSQELAGGNSVSTQKKDIVISDKKIGDIEIVSDYQKELDEIENKALEFIYIIVGLVLVIIIVTSISVELNVIRQLDKIIASAKRMSKGNYNIEQLNVGNDEIGRLSKMFINMRDGIVSHQEGMRQEFEARQQAQLEVDTKTRQISSILKHSSDSYISIDKDQTILFASDKIKDLFRINIDSIIGEKIWDIFPELASFLFKSVKNVSSKVNSIEQEIYYPPSSAWLHVKVYKTDDTISISMSNITEQKKIENILRESERHHRAVVDNVADGIITINFQGHILSLNAAVEKIFSIKADHAIGTSINNLVRNCGDNAVFWSSQKGHQAINMGVYQQCIGINNLMGEIAIEVNITKMYVNDDLQFIAIVRDISKRLEDDEQLRLAEKIFESNNEGIVITNTETEILRVNKSFLQITGYSKEEVIGSKINMLSSKRHSIEFYRKLWESLIQYGHWKGELWNKRKNGEIYPEWLSISSVKDESGEVINYVGIFSDITEKKQAEDRIFKMAHYDELTGLSNRAMFNIELAEAMEYASKLDTSTAILYLDLDHFKKVNDTLGHAVGDEVLRITANRLTTTIRGSDKVGRLGGDEFVVLIQDLLQLNHLSDIASNIIDKIRQPVEINQREVFLGASIGIAVYPQDADNSTDLIKNADAALYKAKNSGRNNYQFYSNEMNAKADERLVLESRLHRALKANEFVLHYQPQIDLNKEQMIGAEALVRWINPEIGMIPPFEFIPILEETGMIIPVGEWILKHACQQAKKWQDEGLGNFRMAVNISPHQFMFSDIVATVKKTLDATGLAPEYLELEITEGSIMTNAEENISKLKKFSDWGIKLSIDDFGTGYSSLAYLKRFPINTLKIDQSFVRNMHTDINDANIVKAIISLAKSLNFSVIAEGVEEDAHLKKLKEYGCDEIQGYYISRPLDEDNIKDFIQNKANTLQLL